MTAREAKARQRRRRPARESAGGGRRSVDYSHLRNPFPPVPVFSEAEVEAIHDAALQVLEELGMKVLLPEARALFAAGGAAVDESEEMVRIGRDIVEAALASAPRSIPVKGAAPHRDLVMELGAVTIQSGGGAPHATDLERGRRPATISDFRELVRLTQQFDVLHMLNPLVEPQDVAVHLRHYAVTEAQLTLSDKVPFIFSRGSPQVLDAFEMIREFRGLAQE